MADADKLTVQGVENLPPMGTQTAVFVKGVEEYEAKSSEVGNTITLTNGDGSKAVKGTLNSLKVGALIDLMGEFGGYAVHTFGRPYSALGLIQALSRAAGQSIDVTKLYTVVVVQVTEQVETQTAPADAGAPAVAQPAPTQPNESLSPVAAS